MPAPSSAARTPGTRPRTSAKGADAPPCQRRRRHAEDCDEHDARVRQHVDVGHHLALQDHPGVAVEHPLGEPSEVGAVGFGAAQVEGGEAGHHHDGDDDEQGDALPRDPSPGEHEPAHRQRRDHGQDAAEVGPQGGQAVHDDARQEERAGQRQERVGGPLGSRLGRQADARPPRPEPAGDHDRGHHEQGEAQVAHAGEAGRGDRRVPERGVELPRPLARRVDDQQEPRGGDDGERGDEEVPPEQHVDEEAQHQRRDDECHRVARDPEPVVAERPGEERERGEHQQRQHPDVQCRPRALPPERQHGGPVDDELQEQEGHAHRHHGPLPEARPRVLPGSARRVDRGSGLTR